VVNSSQGGGSKDTWVLAGSMERAEINTEHGLQGSGGPLHVGVPAVAPNVGQAQQQQQQQQQQETTEPAGTTAAATDVGVREC
jgi:hypothetical protein